MWKYVKVGETCFFVLFCGVTSTGHYSIAAPEGMASPESRAKHVWPGTVAIFRHDEI